MADAITLGDPALNLQITKQHATVVVEPTSQMGGTYDTAIISTVFVINNPGEARDVEFIVPYETERFSAGIAVISAGAEAFQNRLDSLGKITGDLERIKPYLGKLQLPADQYDTNKELRAIAQRFRVGVITVPAGQSSIRVQLSAIVEPQDVNGVKTFSFRAYAPLPGTVVAGGHVTLSIAARFKGDEAIHPQITKSAWSNPYGDTIGAPVIELPAQPHGEDIIFYWKWLNDPVVDFEYHY
ncbi:MAG: hypothetical protein JWN75_825 [Candidatus Saccharibacteria bacterium]|nr:hypothetical protein [Candidatus Saccharibacteria bacterium]